MDWVVIMAKSMGRRAAGCIMTLVGFVALIVAFVVLIFFLFSGLSYFLDGERIELPEWSKMWTFVSENIDGFFRGVDDTISEIPELMGETSETETTSEESAASSEEGALTVVVAEDGSMTLMMPSAF
jgi:hypothetical protein